MIILFLCEKYSSIFYYPNSGEIYRHELSCIECCAAYGSKECFNFLPTRVKLDLSGWADVDIFSHH